MASGSVNKVILVGNLGRDAELRATPGGLEVISFSVATTERKRDRETNQWTDQVEWHRVKMFRDTQKSRSTVHEYLKKGQKVYVEGRLQTRSWDDKDGQKKYSTEIISDRIELLGRKEGGSGGGGGRDRDDDDGGYQGGGASCWTAGAAAKSKERDGRWRARRSSPSEVLREPRAKI